MSSRKVAVFLIFIILLISLNRRKCAVFSLDSGNFLHSSWYETVFWICDQNNIDNTKMFSLLLRSTCTVASPFLPLTPPLSGLGVCKELWGDTAGPKWPHGYPTLCDGCSAYKAGWEEGREGMFKVIFSSHPYAWWIHAFHWAGWTSACLWQMVNSLLCFACVHFLSILNFLYLSPQVISLLLFPIPLEWNEWAASQGLTTTCS